MPAALGSAARSDDLVQDYLAAMQQGTAKTGRPRPIQAARSVLRD